MDKDLAIIVDSFIAFLEKNKKVHRLKEIVGLLQKKMEEEELKSEVVSAVPLSFSQIKALEILLRKKLEKKVKIINVVDLSIIGGLIVKYQDLIIDQSVKRKLSDIEKEIYGH